MAGRSNRRRQRRRRRAEMGKMDPFEEVDPPSTSSPSSGSDRVAQRKIPLPDRREQQSIKDEGDDEEPHSRSGSRDPRALRKFLLSILRNYYIDAIALLPAGMLRSSFAHGILVGGHCYGPLRPVENIIINSVWYAAAFPFRSDTIDVAVVTTEGISRLAHCSLDGLVASLRRQYPALSYDEALWHLGLSRADLHGAAASARGAAPFTRTELEAFPFQAAAQAAGHPKPAALALFVTSVLPAVERDVLSLLAAKRALCFQDILCLSAMLLPFPLQDDPLPQPSPREHNQKIIRIIGEKKKNLKIWYQTLLDIADAALCKFAHQTGEYYQLHAIYGEGIVESGEYGLDRYIHINFLAWRKVDSSWPACQGEAPVHFFAEADNPPTRDCPEECITLCCMLPQLSQCHVGNCYACMICHQKVDHPDAELHFGGHPHRTVETENNYDFPGTVDVDCRFFDPDRDIELVQFYADKIARIKAIRSMFQFERRAHIIEDATTCSKNHFELEDDTNDEDTSDEDTSDEDVSVYCNRYI